MTEKIIITPKTKVLDLIEAYPQLEDLLIKKVPVFSKLKNPLLRRTIGKVATLQQAAATGNVNINELISFFRKEVGQDDTQIQQEDMQYSYKQPEWFSPEKITEDFDVREMLDRGEHPVSKVIDDLKHLSESGIYKMTVQFLPVPLIDKATALGFTHWVDKVNENEYHIYFTRNRS